MGSDEAMSVQEGGINKIDPTYIKVCNTKTVHLRRYFLNIQVNWITDQLNQLYRMYIKTGLVTLFKRI